MVFDILVILFYIREHLKLDLTSISSAFLAVVQAQIILALGYGHHSTSLADPMYLALNILLNLNFGIFRVKIFCRF